MIVDGLTRVVLVCAAVTYSLVPLRANLPGTCFSLSNTRGLCFDVQIVDDDDDVGDEAKDDHDGEDGVLK